MIKKSIKRILRSFIPSYLKELKIRNRIGKQFREWEKKGFGYPVPSHHLVKEHIIREYKKKYNFNILIETGTCYGDMIESQKNNFKKVISIELDPNLFINAKKRFEKTTNVSIFQGDSSIILPQIIKDLNEPALFWLDAHYSGGITAKGTKNSPIIEEINAIFNKSKFNHIILIDDARSFYKLKDYPTIEKLTKLVKSKNSKYKLKVKDDIIQFFL